MNGVLVRMAFVTLLTLAGFGLVLGIVSTLPGLDIVMPLPIWWVATFWVGVVFATWNLWDSVLDARAAFLRGRADRILLGGLWRMRSDALQCMTCCAMVAAGCLAILQFGTVEIRTGLILAGGITLVVNQLWNRLDRERIMRMPPLSGGAREMEQLAMRIAADARQMGHDIRDGLQMPVGELELLRSRPGMTAQEVADIDAAITALMKLADHIQALHQRVKASDPSAVERQDAL